MSVRLASEARSNCKNMSVSNSESFNSLPVCLPRTYSNDCWNCSTSWLANSLLPNTPLNPPNQWLSISCNRFFNLESSRLRLDHHSARSSLVLTREVTSGLVVRSLSWMIASSSSIADLKDA